MPGNLKTRTGRDVIDVIAWRMEDGKRFISFSPVLTEKSKDKKS